MIETARLLLVPYVPSEFLALLQGNPECTSVAGYELAEGMREFMGAADGQISPEFREMLLRATGPDPWCVGFAAIHRDDRLMMGGAGFKGQPVDGMVEIAYGITPSYQGQGYATEAAAGLVQFASADERVSLIRAHTLPVANASGRVLTKCGFERVGEVVDPEDGPVWRWERAKLAG